MMRLLRLAARAFPGAWRDRYGVEFQALLDETTPGWRDVVDVLNGGVQMRLRRAPATLVIAVLGIAGALGAGAIAYHVASRFESTGTMQVRRAVPPSAADDAGLAASMSALARDAFSRDFLTGVIQKHALYPGDRARSSTDDLVNRVRGDIGIELVSPNVVRVSFASADARQARPVANDLISQLVTANMQSGRGSIVQVIDPADEPQASVRPRHVAMASLGGLSGGALIGAVLGWLPRRRSQPQR